MRMIFGLMLTLVSAWLFYTTAEPYLATPLSMMPSTLVHLVNEPRLAAPLLGATCGLFGGAILFLGGFGGGALAVVGAGCTLGFALATHQAIPSEMGGLLRSNLVLGGVMSVATLLSVLGPRGGD